ncbi:MAG: ComF family protein [Deltaproteobacteria bacterium]|jgi:ComF family protein|nr:ComF family protein [Deltaproteobacteria bacterium]MDO9211192.1 ComF family protein [Deltaproteobacteria bacterium]
MGPFWRALVDFFFPSQCPLCGKILDENSLGRPCPSCLSQIKFFSHPYCPRCGLGFNTAMGEDHLCSGCLTEHWDFTKARSIGPYEGLMAEVISRFKFRGISRLAKPLGILLAEYEDPEFTFSEFDLILSVPLHPQRLRKRGFNQSLLLARRISRVHSIPLDFTALQRIRHTQPQTELSGPERKKNIRGAFAVKKSAIISGKRILLIDDVFTTGATVQECSKALLKAGAKRVDVMTLARVL